MAANIRVAIGCRHALLREGLRELLKRWTGIDVVGAAPAATDVERLVGREQPDVLILVRSEDPSDDVQAISATRKLAPQCRVVLIASAGRKNSRAQLGEDARVSQTVGATGLVKLLWELQDDPTVEPTGAARTYRPEPRHVLTEREWDVARAVCEGLPNKTIARQLGISEKTVKNHLSSIYKRAGIAGRTQLAVWAMKNGFAGMSHETDA